MLKKANEPNPTITTEPIGIATAPNAAMVMQASLRGIINDGRTTKTTIISEAMGRYKIEGMVNCASALANSAVTKNMQHINKA